MNINKWFAMLVMMLALTGVVMADSDNETTSNTENVTQGQALSIRYSHMECKVAFTNTQIDLVEEYLSLDLSDNKEELLDDLEALKEFVDDNNKTGFDTYITETVRPDLQNATNELNTIKGNFRQYNLSNESKQEFIAELKDAKETYSECVSDKEIKMAEVMEKHMNNWNKQWGRIIDKMTEKNITMEDAKALQAEIEARNEELKDLIAEGNITKIQEFMKTYHEEQLQYAAQFEVARLKGYRNKLEPLADRYNMSNRLEDIDEKIAGIEEKSRKGYNNGEFRDTWDDLKDTGRDMKKTAKDINQERMKEQKEMMNRQGNEPGKNPRDKGIMNGKPGNDMPENESGEDE